MCKFFATFTIFRSTKIYFYLIYFLFLRKIDFLCSVVPEYIETAKMRIDKICWNSIFDIRIIFVY